MAQQKKPFILFSGTPAAGHITPIIAIAKVLQTRGYSCTFLSSSGFQTAIENAGLNFVPFPERANFTLDEHLNDTFPALQQIHDPMQILQYHMEHLWLGAIPAQANGIQDILKSVQEKDPEREVAVITEVAFTGALPMLGGAPGLRAPVITMGISALMLAGLDTPCFGGRGVIPQYTPESRAQNKAATEFIYGTVLKDQIQIYTDLMRSLGATKRETSAFFDDCVTFPDRFLQMCGPGAEYPRENMPPTLRFVGSLPPGSRDAWEDVPEWWDEVVANRQKRKIVFVCQGTAFTNPTEVIIPTLQALADAPGIVVVAALGIRGATLPADVKVASNCFVADYIPYDAVLAVADVFVMNSGYGGFQHSLQHGVPLVMTGEFADKLEIAARGEWAGVAVNLRSTAPSPEAIKQAVETVLADEKYKERAVALQKELKQYNVFDEVEKSINELAAKLSNQ